MKKISRLKIKGNVPAFGNIEMSGDSVNAVALLVRGLMQYETFEVSNVPRSSVVFDFINILETIGVEIDWIAVDTIKVVFEKSFPTDLTYLNDPRSLDFVKLLIPLTLKKRGSCRVSNLIKSELAFYKRRGFDVKIVKNYSTVTFDKNNVSFVSAINLSKLTSQFDISAKFLILNLVGFDEDELQFVLNTTGILDTWYANLLITDEDSRKLRVRSSRLELAMFSTIAVLTHGEIEFTNFELAESLPYLLLLSKFGGKYLESNKKLKIWVEEMQLEFYYDFTYLDNDYLGYALVLSVVLSRKTNSILHLTIRKTDEIVSFIRTLNIFGFDLLSKSLPNKIILIIKPVKLPIKIKLSVDDDPYIGPLIVLATAIDGNHSLTGISNFIGYSPDMIDVFKSLNIDISFK